MLPWHYEPLRKLRILKDEKVRSPPRFAARDDHLFNVLILLAATKGMSLITVVFLGENLRSQQDFECAVINGWPRGRSTVFWHPQLLQKSGRRLPKDSGIYYSSPRLRLYSPSAHRSFQASRSSWHKIRHILP